MRRKAIVAVIIPAFNEEVSIGKVLSAIPPWVDDVIVVDNGSTDRTPEIARENGARVVSEPKRGYGSACLAGIVALEHPDVVIFLDADFSDYPEEMRLLVDPIAENEVDMVIGSRVLGRHEAGALTLQARFGNWLACLLMRLLWQISYTDLGPFRAVRYSTLRKLNMSDPNYGWTVEMQIKAAREGIRVREVPVSYRRRIGKSKISGTVRGVLGAGTKILYTIFRAALPSSAAASERMGRREKLIIFTRYPEPGKTKTRLIPALGPDGAAGLHQLMTEYTVIQTGDLKHGRPVSLEVRYEGGSKRLMKRWLGPAFVYRRQGKGDIGLRMARAFAKAFEDGFSDVVLIGTDCPGRTANTLKAAFTLLERCDTVLGPARDGGYHLIGLRRMAPELFANIPWGTSNVFRKTIETLHEKRLSRAFVETLDDIDRPEDLRVLEREKGMWSRSRRSSISVIVPALDEADTLPEVLASTVPASGIELIVVDGGSTDRTSDTAREFDARVISSEPGRARQMKAGAAAASGDVLLFLHADTRLPKKFDEHVRSALDSPATVGGAFELRIDSLSPSLRLIERAVNWRSRHLRMPYGDQGIFVRSTVFHEIGGFPDNPIMEDFEFVRRLRRKGNIAIAPVPVVTSPRRWLTVGPLRTTLINQAIIAGYYAGVPLQRLAVWYARYSP